MIRSLPLAIPAFLSGRHAASVSSKGAFMRHRPPPRVGLCGSGPEGRAFLRHGRVEKGLPCGIDFVKIRPPRLRLQQSDSPEAASSVEEVAIWSPEEGRQGTKSGRKTAASLPDDCRRSVAKCRVFVRILRFL